jgi:hypothetical protein
VFGGGGGCLVVVGGVWWWWGVFGGGGGCLVVGEAHIEHNLKKYYKNEKLLPCNTSSKKV